MENLLFLCECSSIEHQLIFSYSKDFEEVFVHTHLSKRNFWGRLKYGFKYIFGYQCRFGAFDEIILNNDDVDKLEKIVQHMKK